MNQELHQVLSGCFNPSSIHHSELRLKQLSQNPHFLQDLLMLVPNQ